MKTLRFAAMGLVALGFAQMASAQTKIYITGSSAYRGSAHTAIMKLLGGSATVLPAGSSYGYNGSSLSGSNAAIFKGNLNGNVAKPVIIKTSWSGSAAGVQTVGATLSGFTVGFLVDGTTTSTTGTSGAVDPRLTTASPREAAVPNAAFSDAYQGSTPFNGTFNAVAYDTLIDNIVGVVPFQFVKSRNAATGITNMTPQLAQATWVGSGFCPLALYTGNSANQGTLVYATGRDADSGTRITAFAETGVGVSTTVQQYTTEATPAQEPVLYAQQTVNGIVFPLGEGGESSGGTLAGATRMGKTGLVNSYVSYMSTGDAATLVSNGGAVLKYNGLDFSLPAVQQGQYTFWGYEHLMYKDSLAGLRLEFAEKLRDQVLNVDGSLLLSTMAVVRFTDGGVVFPNY